MIDIVYDAVLCNVTPLTLPSTSEGQLEYGASLDVRGGGQTQSRLSIQRPSISSRVHIFFLVKIYITTLSLFLIALADLF